MKPKIHYLWNRICNDINDLMKTKWISEIGKTAVISLLTIMVLYLIRLKSPGNYDGAKLETYLEEVILRYIPSKNIKNHILYNDTYDVLSDDKVIFMYSQYTTVDDTEINNGYDGVCLSIFERGKENLFKEILGTLPGYELKFCVNYEGLSMQLLNFDFKNYDIDKDGIKEFWLYTNSYYGSTGSEELILFLKNGDIWTIETPDINEIVDSVSSITNNNVFVTYDMDEKFIDSPGKRNLYLGASLYKFKNLLNVGQQYYNVMGVIHEGEALLCENPFNANFEICYQFPCEYDDSQEIDYICIMQQLNDKHLFVDPNWNMGRPLFIDDKIDLEKNYMSYWGVQIGEKTFFTDPYSGSSN